LPGAIRVDNGSPWATQSDIPSALALWLVGLGVEVIVNRPRQSTDNGIVERGHGVLAGWVEPQRAPGLAAFQQQLDWAITMQRERYPALNGKTRLARYPGLCTPVRSYERWQETDQWQLEQVLAWVARRVWQRRVDKVGRISLFSTTYSVGRAYRSQTVQVQLDPAHCQWVIENEQGVVLKRHPCTEITTERIQALGLAKRANSVSHDAG
jgi:hypothetical protein